MNAPETPPERCSCGFWKRIEHVCPETVKAIKPGTRPLIPSARCVGCNTLHGHLPHDCAQRDAITSGKFTNDPATEEIALKQWSQGWRPQGTCLNCPSLKKPCPGCYARAGYDVKNYAAAFE